jgi:hypothetical protein
MWRSQSCRSTHGVVKKVVDGLHHAPPLESRSDMVHSGPPCNETQRAARSRKIFRLRRLVGLACVPLALSLDAANASEITPFYSFNQSPVVQIYGLPAIGNAKVVAPRHTRIELSEIVANNFTGEPLANETLFLDGESYRTTLIVAHGLGPNLELGFELPYLAIRGGHLDGFIEQFHETFGFPDAGRSQVPRNQLHYKYTRNGTTQFDFADRASGVGDLRLTGAWQLREQAKEHGYVAALRGQLKLPTGDPEIFTGSGGTDFALWLSLACGQAVCSEALQWYGGIGGLYLGRGEVLPAQQRTFVAFGSIGIGYALIPSVFVKLQIDAHSPFFQDSEFSQLVDSAAQILIGFTWWVGKDVSIDLALAEDLIANNSPDVAILFGLRTQF